MSDVHALQTAVCKCCGATASLYGVVDFNKNCEIARGRSVLPLCGVPVYYHRCQACGFIFTVAFDTFSADDFAELVYNAEYALVDPDFAEARPTHNAQMIVEMFGPRRDLRILDFGGGNGLLARRLRATGFAHVDTYDPFVPGHDRRPTGRYDLVLAFEVMEHTPDPAATLAEIDSLLEPAGMVLFSTLLQPQDMDKVGGLTWWYAAPRNGHVSLYSAQSLERLVKPYGYNFGSSSDAVHVLFRTVPPFAQHLFRVAA